MPTSFDGNAAPSFAIRSSLEYRSEANLARCVAPSRFRGQLGLPHESSRGKGVVVIPVAVEGSGYRPITPSTYE